MNSTETSVKGGKFLLIGWDAADWRAITPLLDAGKMPNLEALINRGVMGNLATLQPVLSPMLWTSIGTGKRPYKHGVHGFSEPDPVTGGIRPVTNLSRKTKAIWNILHQEGKFPAVVGWWPSHPPEPMKNGVMISNHYHAINGKDFDSWNFDKSTVHPERLQDVLKDIRFHPSEIEGDMVMTFLPHLATIEKQEELDELIKHPKMRGLYKVISETTTDHSAATAIIQNEPWDFMAVYHDAIDHYGHGFMKYHPPQQKWINDEEFKIWKDVMESGYRYADMQLGAMMELAGEETTIMLMSDHGFHPDQRRPAVLPDEPAGPAAEHRQFGVLVVAGPGIKKDERVYGASLLDITPTILHHFGLPIGEDMDGRVLHDIWEESAQREEKVIPSWDEVEGDAGTHPEGTQISPADSKAALDQLAALGYIDEPDEDKSKAIDNTVRELEYNLAGAYLDGGIYTEAALILERLYEQSPMEHRFAVMLIRCYKSLNRIAEMRDMTETLLDRRKQEAVDAVEELKSLELDKEEKQKEEAERIEAMSEKEKEKFARERRSLFGKANPNLYWVLYQYALADYAEKKYEDALEKVKELDEDFGSRFAALSLRGDIYLQMREWEEARKAYEEARELDEETPGPYLGLARAALGERKLAEAAELALSSISLLYFQPQAHYLRGVALFRLNKFEEAELSFHKTLEQAPLMAGAYRMLSQIARIHYKDTAAAASLKLMGVDARKRAREIREGNIQVRQEEMDEASLERDLPPLLPRPQALVGVEPSEVITLVSGLPRSGTSLMMQILEALEITPFTDGRREADDSNIKGYYEHALATQLLTTKEKDWLLETRGHALKLVATHLRAFPAKVMKEDQNKAVKLHPRLIYMIRPLEQVLASQTTMLARLGKDVPSGDIAKAYRQQEVSARNWAARLGVPAMEVDFPALVADPEVEGKKLLAFLGLEESLLPKILHCVDPSLHREKE